MSSFFRRIHIFDSTEKYDSWSENTWITIFSFILKNMIADETNYQEWYSCADKTLVKMRLS